MKTDIKKLEKSQVEVEVELTDEEFKEYYQPEYDKALSEVELKGYRKGQAPKEIADGAIDKEKIFEEALQKAVRTSLDKVTKENDWTLIDQPRVEVIESLKNVKYKATLTLFPEVKLGDYKALAKEVFKGKVEVTITDEEADKTLDWLLKSRAALTRVAREAKMGDLIEVDLEAESEGKLIPNTSLKGERIVIGESQFIEGFDDKISGHKEKEDFAFSITAPKDYWQKELQGKQLDFKGKIISVYERKIPELNDDFAKGLGEKIKSVDDLKKSIKEGMTMEKEQKEMEKKRVELLTKLAKDSKMDVPQILIDRTLDGLVANMKQMMPKEAVKDEKELDVELRKRLKEQAETNVQSHLVLYKLAKEEGLEPTKEEIEAEAKLAQVDPNTAQGYIYDRIQNQKVFNFLESLVKES